VHVDGSLLAVAAIAEAQELPARPDLGRAPGERPQDPLLGVGEIEVDAVQLRGARAAVQVQAPVQRDGDVGRVIPRRRRAPQHRVRAGHELARRERLDQVVVGAEREPVQAIGDGRLPCQHDYGNA
jgi:hypothetical protein